VTADEHVAVSGSNDHTLKFWELASGDTITSFSGDDPILTCAVAPDGFTVVTGEASGRVVGGNDPPKGPEPRPAGGQNVQPRAHAAPLFAGGSRFNAILQPPERLSIEINGLQDELDRPAGAGGSFQGQQLGHLLVGQPGFGVAELDISDPVVGRFAEDQIT
jgi:hypothetical protein